MLVGVSLKMYFGHREALEWFRAVSQLPELAATGDVECFVAPSFLQIPAALEVFAGTGVAVAAQDVAAFDPGPYTGEVGAAELAEIGVRYAEIGHAERRRLFGDDDSVIAAKVAASLRYGITPVLCVGEPLRASADAAVAVVTGQLARALRDASDAPVVVAYEPVWAIGAAAAAPVDHVRVVTEALAESIPPGSRVLYGGSAGPGLLTALGRSVDGVFLGRFAHDPAALAAVVAEARALRP